jgi:tetratricopeptide (TPR) repeat protein
VARYREAAAIWRETLDSPAKSAEALRAAWQRTPGDLALLEALVVDLSSAGLHAAGASDVAQALEHHAEPSAERAYLLRMRARLELAVGNPFPAVADLEEAYAFAPKESGHELAHGLDAQRAAAAASGDMETERAATHRLARVLSDVGEHESSRAVLAEWVERSPRDREALRVLRETDLRAERWDDVARHNARLVEVEEGEAQVEAALGLADACRRLGQPQYARDGLEHAQRAQPHDERVRDAIRTLYEEIGAHRELAGMLLEDAAAATGDEERRFGLLRRAGELYVTSVGDAEAALGPLSEAAAMRPEDHDLIILLADSYMGSSRLQEAVELLQDAINSFKKRRSPHLAAMQLRMARIAGISGDPDTQKEWLNVALEADKNNNEVAAELAELAIYLGDDDTALKALRVVTLQKTPGPMTKAVAFLRQAQIAHRQGDQQKAVLWARRARLEDDSLGEAQQFLEQIGEA